MGYVVTIDGPAGVGKTTAARALALRLGWFYLDSGALYRAIALGARRAGLDPADPAQRHEAARAAVGAISWARDREGATTLLIDGTDPGQALRTDGIARDASVVASDQVVRELLMPVQRGVRLASDVVAEGRDMGTVVFPDADVKFFMDADPRVRASRRHTEHSRAGRSTEMEIVLEDIKDRDRRDSLRPVSPLRAAGDAVLVDTTDLSAEEVIELLVGTIEGRIPAMVASKAAPVPRPEGSRR